MARPADQHWKSRRQKLDHLNPRDVEHCETYIEKVKKTGHHWRRFVRKLQEKYPHNVVNVYNELKIAVTEENEKRRKKKERERERMQPSTSNKPLFKAPSVSSDDEAPSVASGATFRTTGLKQTMLERERGRPKPKISFNSPHGSVNHVKRAIERAQTPAPNCTTISLSDNSSVHDMDLDFNLFAPSIGTSSAAFGFSSESSGLHPELPPPLSRTRHRSSSPALGSNRQDVFDNDNNTTLPPATFEDPPTPPYPGLSRKRPRSPSMEPLLAPAMQTDFVSSSAPAFFSTSNDSWQNPLIKEKTDPSTADVPAGERHDAYQMAPPILDPEVTNILNKPGALTLFLKQFDQDDISKGGQEAARLHGTKASAHGNAAGIVSQVEPCRDKESGQPISMTVAPSSDNILSAALPAILAAEPSLPLVDTQKTVNAAASSDLVGVAEQVAQGQDVPRTEPIAYGPSPPLADMQMSIDAAALPDSAQGVTPPAQKSDTPYTAPAAQVHTTAPDQGHEKCANLLAIADMEISEVIVNALHAFAFDTVQDLAEARLTRDDVRLLVAAIGDEYKISKLEVIVAIFRLRAAMELYAERSGEQLASGVFTHGT